MKSIAAIIVLIFAASAALAQSDSPCNQGRDPLKEPRNPYAICLPEIGRMTGFSVQCYFYNTEQQLAGVGDVDHSGTMDFIIGNRACDVLLYKGVHGRVPLVSEGVRIGVSEENSRTSFLASGDWDGDGHIDLALRIQIVGDTSGGNASGGYDIARLVVFWGNARGEYTLQDTTRLESGAQMWLSLFYGLGADINGDGVEDLLVSELSGFTKGSVIALPQMMIFKGHGKKRWGRDGIGRNADWWYWEVFPHPHDAITVLDQDRDGAPDIVFARNTETVLGGRLSVLYGKPGGGLPDTNDVQTISFAGSNGRFARFSDVTGDKVPELVISSGRDDFIKVYVGLKGQRLLEQYGSGNDSAQAGAERWWGKPWATIWLPRKINPNWFGDDDQLYDLGDANLDGVGDLFEFSWPYVVVYNGGGKLDSLVDGLVNITPGKEVLSLKRVGDIDGSGRDIIALMTDKELRFYAPTRDISSVGIPRRLPQGTGKAGVEKRDEKIPLEIDRLWLSSVPESWEY